MFDTEGYWIYTELKNSPVRYPDGWTTTLNHSGYRRYKEIGLPDYEWTPIVYVQPSITKKE